eukprot:RCo003844
MDPKMSGGALWTTKMVQEMKKSESSQSFEEKFPGVWIRKKKKKDMSRSCSATSIDSWVSEPNSEEGTAGEGPASPLSHQSPSLRATRGSRCSSQASESSPSLPTGESITRTSSSPHKHSKEHRDGHRSGGALPGTSPSSSNMTPPRPTSSSAAPTQATSFSSLTAGLPGVPAHPAPFLFPAHPVKDPSAAIPSPVHSPGIPAVEPEESPITTPSGFRDFLPSPFGRTPGVHAPSSSSATSSPPPASFGSAAEVLKGTLTTGPTSVSAGTATSSRFQDIFQTFQASIAQGSAAPASPPPPRSTHPRPPGRSARGGVPVAAPSLDEHVQQFVSQQQQQQPSQPLPIPPGIHAIPSTATPPSLFPQSFGEFPGYPMGGATSNISPQPSHVSPQPPHGAPPPPPPGAVPGANTGLPAHQNWQMLQTEKLVQQLYFPGAAGGPQGAAMPPGLGS